MDVTSEAVQIPNGIFKNLNRPYGVVNVVRRDEASSSLTWQKELLASRMEKLAAPNI